MKTHIVQQTKYQLLHNIIDMLIAEIQRIGWDLFS